MSGDSVKPHKNRKEGNPGWKRGELVLVPRNRDWKEEIDGRVDKLLWPPRRCRHCKRWALRWMYVCGFHGGTLYQVRRAAARRRWTAYAALSPAALDAARALINDPKLSSSSRARLATAVLEVTAAPERLPKLG